MFSIRPTIVGWKEIAIMFIDSLTNRRMQKSVDHFPFYFCKPDGNGVNDDGHVHPRTRGLWRRIKERRDEKGCLQRRLNPLPSSRGPRHEFNGPKWILSAWYRHKALKFLHWLQSLFTQYWKYSSSILSGKELKAFFIIQGLLSAPDRFIFNHGKASSTIWP